MPKVHEYLPEAEAQGPVGGTSPLLDHVGAYGRGLESFGQTVQDAHHIITQRDTQAETSDAYANVAEKRAQMMMQIQESTNDGTLDDKGFAAIQKDYQDWTEKQYDSFNTNGGRNAFLRASGRAGGSILQSAARGRAAVAGAQAVASVKKLTVSNSNIVQNDPTQFADVRDAQEEYLQAQIETGVISPAAAQQMRVAMDTDLSKAAVRGWMQADYGNIKASVVSSGGKVDPNELRLNSARHMLDSGGFDQFLDTDEKARLQGEIRANQAAAQAAGMAALRSREIAVGAQGEAFKASAYEDIRLGKYDPASAFKAFQAGLIDSDAQLKLNHLADAAQAKESTSNAAAFNNYMTKILSPENEEGHISDPLSQLAFYVKKDPFEFGPNNLYISKSDYDKLVESHNMVPANRVNAFNEGLLLQKAKTMIGNGPDADYRLMQFTTEVNQAKQNAMANKLPLAPFFDPNSKEYLGNGLQKYVPTPAAILKQQADQIRGQVVPPQSVSVQPGVIPTPSRPWPNAAMGDAIGDQPDSPDTAAPSRMEEIKKMSKTALEKLDPASLSSEEREAAAQRWRELKKPKEGSK